MNFQFLQSINLHIEGIRHPNNTRVKEDLIKTCNGRCKYCNNGMAMSFPKRGKMKDHYVTVDHVYSRLDLRRLLSNKCVLSCHKCNLKRSTEEITRMYDGYDYSEDAFCLDTETVTIHFSEEIQKQLKP